jgi:hypothetical protein
MTESDAAKAVVKLYTMALAQGIQRTMWFEGRDPVGEEQGFGLLNREGNPRPSYRAFKMMTDCLGPTPRYAGWLTLGGRDDGYGFVFQGATQSVLVAWMPAGQTDKTIKFRSDIEMLNPLSNNRSTLKAGEPLSLSDTPLFLLGVPADLAARSKANTSKDFPWGGNYSRVKAVSVQLGSPDGSRGVFPVGGKSTPHFSFPDGTTGVRIDDNQSTRFYTHPSFASFQTRDYYIRITVRRIGAGNAGMNVNYEVADSQARTPYKNRGQWFSLSPDTGWQTNTWHVTDACFSKMWGYDFSLRPEQSVPFVIGKVEASTVPF